MNFDLFSFLLGGVAFLIGFTFLMGWLVPDKASAVAMTWLTSRRNVSWFGCSLGFITFVAMLVIFANAFVKLLRYLQVDPWIYWVAAIGLALALVSAVILFATRRKKSHLGG